MSTDVTKQSVSVIMFPTSSTSMTKQSVSVIVKPKLIRRIKGQLLVNATKNVEYNTQEV